MADLTQTPANVGIQEEGAKGRPITVGEAVTQGMPLSKRSDGKWYKAQADDATDTAIRAGQNGVMVAMTAAGADGDFVYAIGSGKIDLGATLTVGVPYVVSDTAGAIAPASDFSGFTDAYVTHLGYATATDTLDLQPLFTGANNVS